MQNKGTEIAGGPFLCFGKIKPDCTTHGDGCFLRWHLRLTAPNLGQAIFLGTRSLRDLAFSQEIQVLLQLMMTISDVEGGLRCERRPG